MQRELDAAGVVLATCAIRFNTKLFMKNKVMDLELSFYVQTRIFRVK